MTTVQAFDPGLITGWAKGEFSDTEPLTITDTKTLKYEWFTDGTFTSGFRERYTADHTVVEQFILRDNEFKADLTGVRVEGILDWWYFPIIWRPPSKKAQVPDSILKEHQLWKTGTFVEWEDGRDVNDAIIHMLGYVAFDLRHVPTLRKYFRAN